MFDIGLLLVRLVVGGLLAGHGLQKLTGWFGGPGPDGATEYLRTLGYRQPRRLAWLHAGTEVAAGLLFALGALTPAAAAAIVAVMLNAAVAVHARNGLWVQGGGYEYPLVLGVTALAVALSGPGRVSVDAVVGLEPTATWTLGVLVTGLLAGTVVLATRRRPVPRPVERVDDDARRTPVAA